MYSRTLILIALMPMLLCGAAFGDGKFYFRDDISAELPFQRAAIVYEDGTETLVVQSRYAADIPENAADIAWVVPVPNVPELIDIDNASGMFLHLAMTARPHVIHVIPLLLLLLAICYVIFVIWRCKKLKTLARTHPENSPQANAAQRRIGLWILTAIFALLVYSAFSASLGTAKWLDVNVIDAKRVGVYDVKVIRSDSASAIVQWLGDNGFAYDSEDQQVFEKYVQDKWCFVTAKIHEDVDPAADSDKIFHGSMTAPLCLRFEADQPVYPMALTATASTQTEVVLYLLTDSKMQCGGRLAMDFFGSAGKPRLPLASDGNNAESERKYLPFKSETFKLTRFHSKLSPEQMAEDIVFTKADNQSHYRPTHWRGGLTVKCNA